MRTEIRRNLNFSKFIARKQYDGFKNSYSPSNYLGSKTANLSEELPETAVQSTIALKPS